VVHLGPRHATSNDEDVMKKQQDRKAIKATKAQVRNLAPRKGEQTKGGHARSDLGAKLQMQLTEANSIYQ
jgi:hypothetical protein